MAGIIVMIVKDPVYNGLDQYGSGQFAGFHIMAQLGTVLTLESAYQVGYQIAQKYAGDEGVSAERFSSSAPMALTEGKALMSSAMNSATN
jgi:hypothetical protein